MGLRVSLISYRPKGSSGERGGGGVTAESVADSCFRTLWRGWRRVEVVIQLGAAGLGVLQVGHVGVHSSSSLITPHSL